MKHHLTIILQLIFLSLVISCDSPGTVHVNLDDSDDFETLSPMVKKTEFGIIDSSQVYLFTLTNLQGIKVSITNYGGIITSILVPDKNGKAGDIVLGYDSLDQYISNNPYFGAIVGRYANRIAHGQFVLDGKTYKLAINNGKNSLHGGIRGFDKVIWDAREVADSTKAILELYYLSKSGEEGFPGNLKVKVTYTLDDFNDFTTLIEAETDQATPVNLCNHTYFNLSEADTNILGHILTLNANSFTEVNEELIPNGKLIDVSGTPMDFNNSVRIGERISSVKGGYDHNFVLEKRPGELSLAAQVYDPRTGRQVEILTTQPGIQLYSGNFLDGSIRGKGGKIYKQHFGLCLETQHFPDSPNQPYFPNTILRPGEKYSEKTVYRFSTYK
jgi:aldose 1-epimerase